jgi:hypothetical protein
MAFKRSNKMNLREQKTMDSLLEIISTSNNEELQHEANMYKLRSTFGRDSMNSEQSQFNSSNSEAAISNSQSAYDKEHERWRTVGTNADDFDKDRATVLRESGNANSLARRTSAYGKTQSAFERANYSR